MITQTAPQDLDVLALAQEVLDEVAPIMREWGADSACPAAFGKLAWDYAPTLADASRVLRRSRYTTFRHPDA